MYPNGTFQDEIKSAIRQIVEIIKKPLLAIRSSITRIKANLSVIVNKMKKGMLAVKHTVIELGEGVLLIWISSVVHTINNMIVIIPSKILLSFSRILYLWNVCVMNIVILLYSNVTYFFKLFDLFKISSIVTYWS